MCNLDKLHTLEATEHAWKGVLDVLEAEIAGLRRFASDSGVLFELPTEWEQPTNIGRLPATLQDRAQAVFGQMQDLAGMLTERRDETARQLRAVDSIPRYESPTSLYLDVEG